MTDNEIELIVAALDGGDAQVAERLCRDLLQQEPDNADLLVLLALSLWQQGNHEGALALYGRLTYLYPEDSVHWRNYAAVLRKTGDLEAAERAYAAAVQWAPDDAELLELYGLLQMDLEQPVEARNTLLRAFGKAPESPAIRIHAALACLACRDLRAEHLLRPWREWLPLDDFLQSELATAHSKNGDLKAAVELLEDLGRRHPEERSVRLRLADSYERMNRLDEAEALLESVASESTGIEGVAEVQEINRQRAKLAIRWGKYASARATLESLGPRNERDSAHWFELAQACDKMSDITATMEALNLAHSIQIAEIKALHPHWFEAGSEILPQQSERVTHSDYAKWPALSAPDVSQSPVFVVGFPRSGTTLLEQMLDAHPHLQSMDERPFFNMLTSQLEGSTGVKIPRDLGKLNQRDCDELRKGYLVLACGKVPRRWDARLVDKNPMNMLWLPMIHRLFPAAKIIFALRHPCDVLLSNYMQNFKSATLAATCESLETLARSYVATMQQWLYHAELFKPAVFVSRYEDLVTDPVRQTRRIADHLELDDADSMLAFDRRAREKGFIATPSYTQVIEPINVKGMNRWERYREYFEPAVLSILAPMLEHWGYMAEGAVIAAK